MIRSIKAENISLITVLRIIMEDKAFFYEFLAKLSSYQSLYSSVAEHCSRKAGVVSSILIGGISLFHINFSKR